MQVKSVALILALLLCGPAQAAQPLYAPPGSPAQTLIDAGKVYQGGVGSILQGQEQGDLARLAEQHALEQANACRQSHDGFDGRYAELRRLLPECRDFVEVANESWPGQNEQDAAREMHHSWQQSRGHWRAVNTPCRYYGYGMALGRNGTWYACGIVGY